MNALYKFLRKIRIDRDEIALDMANKLGVSPAYLSSVETGKRPMPVDWIETLCALYELNGEQRAEFERIVNRSEIPNSCGNNFILL